MSASAEQPERLAEILREIIALSKSLPAKDLQRTNNRHLDLQLSDLESAPKPEQYLLNKDSEVADEAYS